MSDLPSRKFIKTNGERFKSLPREAIVAAAIGDGAVADLVEVWEVFTGSGWIPLSNIVAAIGEGDEGTARR